METVFHWNITKLIILTTTTTTPTINNKREIRGWAMYDWANSAFSTTVAVVFLGPYLAALVEAAAKASPDGVARILGLPMAPDSFLPCVPQRPIR